MVEESLGVQKDLQRNWKYSNIYLTQGNHNQSIGISFLKGNLKKFTLFLDITSENIESVICSEPCQTERFAKIVIDF